MAELPKAWGVLYAPPNPDGSAKRCGNCVMFAPDRQACLIHSQDVEILEGMVCGYHVFGEPHFALVVPVDPKLSGLDDVSDLGGTTCGTCRFFEPTGRVKGLCHGVAGPKGVPPQPVEAGGCCARWERL